MYGILFTDIYHKNQLNVVEYIMDGIGERTSEKTGEFLHLKKIAAQLHNVLVYFLGLVLTSNHLC